MEDIISRLMQNIDKCLQPKLERNCEECKHHDEYTLRKDILTAEFPITFNLLGEVDLRHVSAAAGVLSSLLIMYEELRLDAVWNPEVSKEYAKQLNNFLELSCDITFDNMLKVERPFYEPQEVFDCCMEKIHRRLTPETFKRYPATIDVYCKLIQNIKDYSIAVNPQQTLPASLLLIDDYMTVHKTKGLKSCAAILQSMASNGFHNGNYYEVVYTSLKNSLQVQYVDVNKLSHICLMELIRLLPAQEKTVKSGDLFVVTLEQLYQESNLLRKANNFRFSKKLIEINGVNCVNRKKAFCTIVCDNLDTCSNVDVAQMLLMSILECFEEWIKHCWCVWNVRLPSDQHLLSLLLKVMYINIHDEQLSKKLQEILETLICISTKEDQQQILGSLEARRQLTSQEFLRRLEATRNEARSFAHRP
ncbi:uncharacterized protein LOC134664332 [Cydia fagiglandana]|uniref:uncharacterized protein LOC134664332 n=1 Tax=Cydia fagiglandana TaxID=1458189 RepID=UPI002FEE5B00